MTYSFINSSVISQTVLTKFCIFAVNMVKFEHIFPRFYRLQQMIRNVIKYINLILSI